MQDYLRIPVEDLDAFLHRAALAYAHQQDDEWLNAIMGALRVDYTKEFVLTTEYLDLYTKDQLLTLAKAAGANSLNAADLAKKESLISAILSRAPPGYVPREFLQAGEVAR